MGTSPWITANGEITVFDDACYFWYVYELACAWEGGVGRTMFQPLSDRVAFTDHYFTHVLEGYGQHKSLSEDWLARVPLFPKVVEMEEVLHCIPRLEDLEQDERARLDFKIASVERDLLWASLMPSIRLTGRSRSRSGLVRYHTRGGSTIW